MKWPWSSRADDAEQRAEDARKMLERVEARWPQVHEAIELSRERRFAHDHLTKAFLEGRHRG